MSKFVCPNCGSENIQKMEIVFQSGTFSNFSTTTYKNNVGERVNAETAENSSSALADAVAPPEEEDVSWWPVWGCAFLAAWFADELLKKFDFLKLIVVIVLGIIAYGCYLNASAKEKWNKEEYPKLYDEWCKSFICHKCGHRFIIK